MNNPRDAKVERYAEEAAAPPPLTTTPTDTNVQTGVGVTMEVIAAPVHDENRLVLSEPLTITKDGSKQQVSTLQLRRPTGMDFIDFGMPFDFVIVPDQVQQIDGQETVFNNPVIGRYLARLANISAEEVGEISSSDWYAFINWLSRRTAPSGEVTDDNKTFNLTSPITVHSGKGVEQINTLKLKRPNAGAIMANGQPFNVISVGGGQKTVFNLSAVGRHLVSMTGYSLGELGAMNAGDMVGLSMWLTETLARSLGRDLGNSA